MDKILLLTLLFLLLGGCAGNSITPTAGNAAWAIASAQTAQRRAAAVGYEWRDTGTLIAAARAAADAREFARAIELAARAQCQGRAAMTQHLEQQRAVRRHPLW